MNKKINYLARSYNDIKKELIEFSKQYYPELTNNLNDASIGSWIIDLVSAVGDNLSYHTDRMYQENNINNTTTLSSIINNARLNGIHIPGPKASMCEVELTCELPVNHVKEKISQPNWEYAPIIKQGGVVGNNNYRFQINDDVNFANQFNKDGMSNRKFYPKRNSNGVIESYIVSKTAIAYSGINKIYKKELSPNDVYPFMEIVLPDKNIMNIESIIFKESVPLDKDPDLYEYYIDEEQFRFNKEDINTYRFFEVDSLSDQYIFGNDNGTNMHFNASCESPNSYVDYTENTIPKAPENVLDAIEGVVYYQGVTKEQEKDSGTTESGSGTTEGDSGTTEGTLDSICLVMKVKDSNSANGASYRKITNGNIFTSSQRTTRYYKGKWKPITQKFISEYTDNGYLKIIFGSGVRPNELDPENNYTEFGKKMMNSIINNDLLGVLPKIGWTMYVLYRTGGGSETNLSQGAINTVINIKTEFPNHNMQTFEKSNIIRSFKVKNLSPSIGGRDFPSVDELRNYIKYAVQEQKRCVTIKDYKSRIMMMPSKYGCPFRCNVIEENNKIILSCLGLGANNNLIDGIPEIMRKNMIEYLSHFKTIGDYVEIKSGQIYNLGFQIDIIANKVYNVSDIVKTIIKRVNDYMDVNKHEMGENVFLGDLQKEINNIDGVNNLIDLKVYSLYNGLYSQNPSNMPASNSEDKFPISTCDSFQIDTTKTDNMLINNYNSMFEILNPSTDIIIRTKII